MICEQSRPRCASLRGRAPRPGPRDDRAQGAREGARPALRSAAALGDDIGRFLAAQPILARPPSTLYQLRKRVRAQQAALRLAAAAVARLIGLAAAMSVLYARAERNLVRALAAEERARKSFRLARELSTSTSPRSGRTPSCARTASNRCGATSSRPRACSTRSSRHSRTVGGAAHELGGAILRLANIDRRPARAPRREGGPRRPRAGRTTGRGAPQRAVEPAPGRDAPSEPRRPVLGYHPQRGSREGAPPRERARRAALQSEPERRRGRDPGGAARTHSTIWPRY